MLLDHSERIDLNTRDIDGATAFMNACFFGHKDVVKLLMGHFKRIDLNTTDNDGDTAFMIACERGHKDVVKLLLDHSKYNDFNIEENFNLSKETKDLIDKSPAFIFVINTVSIFSIKASSLINADISLTYEFSDLPVIMDSLLLDSCSGQVSFQVDENMLSRLKRGQTIHLIQ